MKLPSRHALAALSLTVIVAAATSVAALSGEDDDAADEDIAALDGTATVERGDTGEILHRRLPSSDKADDGGIFQYEPHAAQTTLPSQMHRDGNAHPMPELTVTAGSDESILTENGFVRAQPPAEAIVADGSDAAAEPDETTAPSPSSPPASSDDSASDPPRPGAAGLDAERPAAPPVMDPRVLMGHKAAPDRDTQREGRLDYHAVFDPSLVPFKRNRALNSVTAEYAVVLERGHIRHVKPAGIITEVGRESFWGSVLLEGNAGAMIPLPSIAPDSRLLRAEVVPALPVTFWKDGADNFYIKPGTTGRFRLVFVMDAPTSYFGRQLPDSTVRLSHVPRTKLPPLPAGVRKAALEFAAELGLPGRHGYTTTLRRLVSHFRSFEPGDPPPPTGDIYLDLARGKKGICRHRSFGFVVTALALGIPARYVFNEAHVFVEVYVAGPDPGWLRIDLGGGADSMHVHSGRDKLQHQPRTADPFDRPEAFANAATAGQMAGASDVHGAPARTRAPPPAATRSAEVAAPPTSSIHIPVPAPVALGGRVATVTTLSLSSSHAFRGDSVTAQGTVARRSGDPLRSGTVQILLATAATHEPIRLLATAALDSRGRFEVSFSYPNDQAPGSYEVKAQFMGNASEKPSLSH